MDLFMIRLENGNSVVLQAENEAQALEFAGLRSDPHELAETLTERSGEQHDPAEVHLMMVNSGVGPQNYTIRKLKNFMCEFTLTDEGEFEARLASTDQAYDEFYVDYPELDKAFDETAAPLLADDKWRDHLDAHRERTRRAVAAAVAKERTRFTAIL
ncbi:MAG TPA: hypothetical protein VK638_10090 [Edaphobacter sp.]|nr:hypothetical protein [Edaphobacter sp.]